MQKITLHILRTLGSALLLLLPLIGTAQVPASQAYETFDIDYCQTDGSVHYNFYWPGGHVSGSPFFGSNSGAKLTFTEFDDGTALIEGTTVQGTCEAQVYVVLVGLSNWTEWQAKGGSYKEMGCSQPDPTQMRYYEIDDSRSYITVTGGDCIETGTFTVSQRPDPNDPNTPHLGAHIGIGGAGWDTDKTAEGLATWGWIGTQADPQKWIMDFNFHIEEEPGDLSCEVTGTDVDCYGDNDGTASVQVTGGVMPYSYAWDNGIADTDAMVDNLAPGMYSVTVTDANGAKTECSVTIEGPDAALSCETEVLSDVTINGGSDGSAKVTASGGTMPYSYMWENGETTQTVNNLTVGTHEVKVTDANGCETICKVEIKEPGALSCEVTGTDVDCYGDNDGTASVQVTGGVMPYSYAWDNGIADTDAMVDNLAPGMYSVTVTDANGAKTECSVIIEGPDAALTCETEVVSDVTEQGGADGSAKVTAMGGTMPYSYEWDNGETTQTAVNLSAGIHEVTVTDANGCETICEVEIDEPDVDPEPGCETAFARYEPTAVCFLDDGFNRWGWTNFFADEDTYTFESYSGAGQCNLNAGTHSANVTVVYANGMATVTIETLPGYYMTEVQLYIGDDKYPTQGNSNTVAPGQYPYKETGLNNATTYTFDPVQVGDNGFWMILHSVTCGENGTDRAVTNGKLMQLKPYPTVFDNSLQVAVDATEDTEVNVAVYSSSGVQVLTQKVRLSKGHNEIPLSMPGLNAAMYILEVSTLDGERLTAKLISK